MRPRVASFIVITLLITIAALAAAPAGAPVAPKYILLRPQRVFDATSAATHEGWSVLVSGEKIVSVGPSLALPPGTTTIDLPGMTLLPGLIDAHSHIFSIRTTRRSGTIKCCTSRLPIERSRNAARARHAPCRLYHASRPRHRGSWVRRCGGEAGHR